MITLLLSIVMLLIGVVISAFCALLLAIGIPILCILVIILPFVVMDILLLKRIFGGAKKK